MQGVHVYEYVYVSGVKALNLFRLSGLTKIAETKLYGPNICIPNLYYRMGL